MKNLPKESTTNPNWLRMKFRNNKVWVALSQDGKALVREGKVLIKYQLNQDYEYWVKENDVHDLDGKEVAAGEKSKAAKPAKKAKTPALNEESIPDPEKDPGNTVFVYTDGASSGNPGPAGIGVVLKCKDLHKEISQYIGEATNNIAELEAIRTGLLAIKNTGLPIRVFTDSSYALGVLSKGWKPKKNQDLIESIMELKKKFKDLKFIKVKGHSGHPENEAADRLATSAIKQVNSER
jgi:ribonuclease HI